MKKLIILLLLLAGTTSVYAASTFQWSRLSHTRLNNFVRLTKLPVGEYLIGVYSTGNTIQEYNPTEPVVITNTKEVIKEVRIEVPVITEKLIMIEKPTCSNGIVFNKTDIDNIKNRCLRESWYMYDPQCVMNFLYQKSFFD